MNIRDLVESVEHHGEQSQRQSVTQRFLLHFEVQGGADSNMKMLENGLVLRGLEVPANCHKESALPVVGDRQLISKVPHKRALARAGRAVHHRAIRSARGSQ